MIAADLRFVSRQSGEVICQRVEGVQAAIVLLALLPLGLDIDIHAELDTVYTAGPTHVVEELDASRVVNVGAVRATAQRSEIVDIDLRQGTDRLLDAVIVDPLAAEFADQGWTEHRGQSAFHALARAVENGVVC